MSWTDDHAARFHALVLSGAGAVPKTEDTLRTTRAHLAADEPVTGWPSLAGIVGKEVIDLTIKWLAIEPAPFPCSDVGNAARLVARHGNDLRFIPGVGWLVWNGRRWARDDAGQRVERAKDTAQSIWSEIPKAAQAATLLGAADAVKDRPKKLAAHAAKSQARSRIEAMIALAQSDPSIVARAEDLDRDPMLFNVQNGTIDLRTGVLRSHDRADLITKLSPVIFDLVATATTWDRFLARSLPSADVRSFVQKFIGYCLSGDVREDVLAFFYGSGANGKSVFMGAVFEALGDYAGPAAPKLLMARHGESHPTELADLRGLRLVAATEVEEGSRWDEPRLKELTGRETIKARAMYQDFVSFKPSHKFIISGNHKPIVKGTDGGIWRRMRIVPWTVVIPESERDTSLPSKLRAELPGILRWCVEGCLAWQREGLGAPVEIAEATEGYRVEQDVLGVFLNEECAVVSGQETKSADLYAHYRHWAERGGLHPITQMRFGLALKERGLHSRKSNGLIVWVGIRLTGRAGALGIDFGKVFS